MTLIANTLIFLTLTSSGFLPHILQPTRIAEYSSTVIDNMYGNNFDQNSQW